MGPILPPSFPGARARIIPCPCGAVDATPAILFTLSTPTDACGWLWRAIFGRELEAASCLSMPPMARSLCGGRAHVRARIQRSGTSPACDAPLLAGLGHEQAPAGVRLEAGQAVFA